MINNLRLDRFRLWQIDVAAIAFIIMASLATYSFEVVPSLARHNAAIAKQHELEGRRIRKQELEATLQRMQRRKTASEQFVSGSGFALKALSRMNDRIALLGEMASAAGLQVEGFEPARPETSGLLIATDIRLSAKGSYPDVERFLATLHTKLPDSVVVSFELSAQPAAKEPLAAIIIHMMWHATPDDSLKIAGN